jgi:hypothetical protein
LDSSLPSVRSLDSTTPHDIKVHEAQPALPHYAQFLCTLGILDDEFIALEAVGQGGDAGWANFGHR